MLCIRQLLHIKHRDLINTCSVQRTNNVLESYNRRFGNKFPHPNPSLLQFGEIVDVETDEWVKKTEFAQQDVYVNARKRKELEWPKIPEDFEDFVPAKKRKKDKSKKSSK